MYQPKTKGGRRIISYYATVDEDGREFTAIKFLCDKYHRGSVDIYYGEPFELECRLCAQEEAADTPFVTGGKRMDRWTEVEERFQSAQSVAAGFGLTMTEEYKNMTTSHTWTCEHGHTFTCALGNLRNAHKKHLMARKPGTYVACPSCKFDMYAASTGLKRLTTNHYCGRKMSLWKCLKCGNQISASLNAQPVCCGV